MSKISVGPNIFILLSAIIIVAVFLFSPLKTDAAEDACGLFAWKCWFSNPSDPRPIWFETPAANFLQSRAKKAESVLQESVLQTREKEWNDMIRSYDTDYEAVAAWNKNSFDCNDAKAAKGLGFCSREEKKQYFLTSPLPVDEALARSRALDRQLQEPIESVIDPDLVPSPGRKIPEYSPEPVYGTDYNSDGSLKNNRESIRRDDRSETDFDIGKWADAEKEAQDVSAKLNYSFLDGLLGRKQNNSISAFDDLIESQPQSKWVQLQNPFGLTATDINDYVGIRPEWTYEPKSPQGPDYPGDYSLYNPDYSGIRVRSYESIPPQDQSFERPSLLFAPSVTYQDFTQDDMRSPGNADYADLDGGSEYGD